MWIFLTSGFYSVVAHRDAPDRVIVRTRERVAIDHFAAACPAGAVTPVENPTADYPYRAEVPRELWVAFLSKEAAELTATNFKNAAHARRGTGSYTRALHRVWAVLAEEFRGQRPERRLAGLPVVEDHHLPDGSFGIVHKR